MKKVVVTGMGAVTSLGDNWDDFSRKLFDGVSGVRAMPEWDIYRELNTKLGAPIDDFETPSHYTRKQVRSMGRISLLATRASEIALEDAGLLGDPVLTSGEVGIAYGSSTGSTDAVKDFANMLINGSMTGITATTYIRMMSHTSPVNVGIFFGLRGRIITTSSACTSGSQAIGYACEAIRQGKQTLMLAGGGEELCPTEAAVFDTLYATSTKNDAPTTTPRPFDKDRDGLVIGEGAGTLVLEEKEHALARGATIYAELVGFATNSDGGHVTQPNSETMEVALRQALADANLQPEDIKYVNGHGTATDRGDIAESNATQRVFGSNISFSTLKGHIGHTLGGCGAIEAWASIEMMRQKRFSQTLNLVNPDPECGDIDYIMGQAREIDCEHVMSNNFAFGGINTSLIFRNT